MVEQVVPWRGLRSLCLRVPGWDVGVIGISNDARADPATLAQLVLQAAVEDRPGVLPMPGLPPKDECAKWPGRYLDRNSGATVDVSLSDDGVPMATTYGNVARLHLGPDGRLEAAHVAPDFFATLSDDAGNLEVELDAG